MALELLHQVVLDLGGHVDAHEAALARQKAPHHLRYAAH
jgi:hypothetical protein